MLAPFFLIPRRLIYDAFMNPLRLPCKKSALSSRNTMDGQRCAVEVIPFLAMGGGYMILNPLRILVV